MSSKIKKSNEFIWLFGIVLLILLFLNLLGSFSFYGSALIILVFLIFLTILGIWLSIKGHKVSHVPARATQVYDNLSPSLPVSPNYPESLSLAPLPKLSPKLSNQYNPSLYRQSLQDYQKEEADLRGVIEKSNIGPTPKLPKAMNPEKKEEKSDSKYKIAEEVEEILNRYRTSDIYKNYSNQTGNPPAAHSSIVLPPYKGEEKKEESKEVKEVEKFKKLEVREKEKKETKKHKWVNVSEDKKGKVKFKEEEVEYTNINLEENNEKKEYDPDREAEEYILKLNKKRHELVDGEEEEEVKKEEDKENTDEEESFY